MLKVIDLIKKKLLSFNRSNKKVISISVNSKRCDDKKTCGSGNSNRLNNNKLVFVLTVINSSSN